MAVPISYLEIKKYVNSEETGNGCVLLTNEDEFEERKETQKRVGSRIDLEIQCKCGNLFQTCFNVFKQSKKQCKKCNLKELKLKKEEIIIITPETKVCNRCKNELPLNECYYRLKKTRNKYNYYGTCKQCEIEIRMFNEFHIKDNRVGSKKCKICQRELPRSKQYFYSNTTNKDGLSYICKECNGSKFKKEGFITCRVCKEEFPATKEYYYVRKDGTFKTACKKCETIISYPYNKKRRKEKADEIREWSRKYRETHKKEKSEHDKKYRNTPNGKLARKLSNWKRMSKKKNLISDLTKEEWYDCLKYFTEEDGLVHCAYCNCILSKITQDHFIPISKGGNYTKNNILPCCSSCNSSKNNKDFATWYKEKEFYSLEREEKIKSYIENC